MNATLKRHYRAARKQGTPAKFALAIARDQVRIEFIGLDNTDSQIVQLDGIMYTVKIKIDPDSSAFDWSDCFYATPSDHYSKSDPGVEYVGYSGRDSYYYPRAEAISRAIAENRKSPHWPRGTQFEDAVAVVEKEIAWWRRWFNDSIYYVGVIIEAESAEGFTAEQSIWGVEAGDGSWRSIAVDLIDQCRAEIRDQQQDRIDALDDALTADFAGIEFA